MIALMIVYLLFCISLISMVMETRMDFYKNPRFWMLFLTFLALIGMTGMSVFG
jgi:hypothetical protein